MTVGGLPFHLQRQRWRFVGQATLVDLLASSVTAALLFWLFLPMIGFAVPIRTFSIIHALVLMTLLATRRIAVKSRCQMFPADEHAPHQMSLLLVGAGRLADVFLGAMGQDREARYGVVGLLSTKQWEEGRLTRCPIMLNRDQIADMVGGKRVLITGAGGSIESELVMIGSPRSMHFPEVKLAIEALNGVALQGDVAATISLPAPFVPEFASRRQSAYGDGVTNSRGV